MKELRRLTKDFFARHWNEALIGEPAPEWRTWDRKGAPGEAEMGGCYAIYEGSQLLYIGSAVTKGKNASKGKPYGLLSRLRRHVLMGPDGSQGYTRVHERHKERWSEMDKIVLIGFPNAYRYLAAALELRLIDQLDPKINAQARWRRNEEKPIAA